MRQPNFYLQEHPAPVKWLIAIVHRIECSSLGPGRYFLVLIAESWGYYCDRLQKAGM